MVCETLFGLEGEAVARAIRRNQKKGIAGERVESLGAEPWTRSLSLVILTKDRGTSDVRYGQEP